MMKENSNQIVHGMWIGEHLSPLELLSIRSFLDHGHEYWLWTYNELVSPLPANLVIKDAATIIPAHKVFAYQKGNQFGHGKGSYAGFSDLFRYKLLYEYGGWWADLDITCLRPLDFETPYVFRAHDVLPVVGNLMKCPAHSQLMLDCYETALREVNALNTDWMKPIRILNDYIHKHQLTTFIIPEISNPDRWEIVDFYRAYPARIPRHYYAFHWMNEEWRSRNLDKYACYKYSTLDHLMAVHHISITRRPPSSYAQYVWKWIAFRLIPLIPRPLRLLAKMLKKTLRAPLVFARELVPRHSKTTVNKRLI